MSLNIRERRQQIAAYFRDNAAAGIATISEVLGIPKSSVHRHRQAIAQTQHPESACWATPAGSAWLKLLVLGIVYCFGIKQGVGSESLSEFLGLVRLNDQIGSSASALRGLKQQMKEAILAYEIAQASTCQPQSGSGICVGGDETFFGGLPILVMMELSSGYILSEVACENRTYATWLDQIGQWWTQGAWKCHFMVSDGAKALIKLALCGLETVSVPDLFHALRGLSQPLGSALARQVRRLQKQQQQVQQQLAKTIEANQRHGLEQSLAAIRQQVSQVDAAQQSFQESLHRLTETIHPFHLTTSDGQLATDLTQRLQPPLAQLDTLALTYGNDKARQAIEGFRSQIPGLAQGLQAWWQWTTAALALQTDDVDLQNWIITALLPWVYWQQQTAKTRHPDLKQRYQQAATQAHDALRQHPWTAQIKPLQQQQWLTWGEWMTAKYQRTSSAVEGRNGYLSRLHQAGRGFSPQTLKVATIIHNFDLKRADGTTAAQRLFDHEFPNLFAWVVNAMGDLPMPRKSSKAHPPKPPSKLVFPA